MPQLSIAHHSTGSVLRRWHSYEYQAATAVTVCSRARPRAIAIANGRLQEATLGIETLNACPCALFCFLSSVSSFCFALFPHTHNGTMALT